MKRSKSHGMGLKGVLTKVGEADDIGFLLPFVLSISALVIAVNLAIDPSRERTLLGIALLAVLSILWLLLQLGRTGVARHGLVAILWLTTAVASLFSGGLVSPILPAELVIILVAFKLAGRRAAVFWTVLTILLMVGFALPGQEALGSISSIEYNPLSWLAILALGALILFLMSRLERRRKVQLQAVTFDEAVAALPGSAALLRAFFTAEDDLMQLVDRDGVILLVNPPGAARLGLTPQDLFYKTDLAWLSPEDAERLSDGDRVVLETGSAQPEDLSLLIRGDARVFRVTRFAYRPTDGDVAGVIRLLRDVTAARRLEDELRTLERRYKALFEGNAEGILLVDPEGRIVDHSEHAAQLLGVPSEQLRGVPFRQFIAESELEEQEAQFKALLTGAEIRSMERMLVKKNGRPFAAEVSLGLVSGEDGAPPQIQILFRDISERKRVDMERNGLLENLRDRTRQIQTAFEVSKSIASTLDLKNLLGQTVQIIKQRFGFYYVGAFLIEEGAAVLAAGSGEQGRKMLAAGHRLPLDSTSMVGWCIEHRRARVALDVGKDPVRFNNPLTPKTRSELAMPLVLHGQAIGALTVQSEFPSAFNNEDVAVLQIMADQLAVAVQNARLHERITNYAGELEQRVRERTAELEALNRELEAFSYSISHDLRTPLRAIHGYSNILVEAHGESLPDGLQTYLEKIHSNALRMGNLIDDLLEFSRLGRRSIRRQEFDPLALVHETLDEFEPELAGRAVEITLDPLPVMYADRSLIKQVFVNLIGNALKFTRTGADTRIHIGHGDGARGPAYFVQDNGVGFDPQFADRIFGVFQRLHRDDEFEGTGVGLAIVHRIIERHGGEVWCDAQLGEGATFYFRLPDGV